jgi:phosphoribosylformylglycinamidine synthase PurS subunit
MKFGIKVMPRDVILDTQGRAVEQTLKLQSQPVKTCRVGKFIEVEIEDASPEEAVQKVQKMAESLFCNPLIEKFEIQKL